jgi:hypothetical protein
MPFGKSLSPVEHCATQCNVVLSAMIAAFSRQSTSTIQSLSQKTDANTYFCVLYFFDTANHCLHSLECSLVSGTHMWTQVSSVVTKRLKEISQNLVKISPKWLMKQALGHASDSTGVFGHPFG